MNLGTSALWIVFGAIVLVLLILDLGVFHRKSHAVSTKEAAIWTAVWIGLALLFNLAILNLKGPEPALQYLTGYIIEKSLSVDNLFVFVVLFSSFAVAPAQQHRVLFWGILGALIMRGALIAGGAVLMEKFSWIAYIFGAFLVFTGLKLGIKRESKPDPERNLVLRIARRVLPLSTDDQGGKFWIVQGGKLLVTPLFLVLITVETTDLVFALDSIPAIFAVTTDPLVVFTSNIFAILGLRSLYFLLSGAIGKFHYLQTALAAILTFVGIKMLIAHFYKIPIFVSLSVVIGLVALALFASWARNRMLVRRAVLATAEVTDESG